MNHKLLKNGLYNAAAGVVKIGLAILTIPVLINLIGVEEYGLWTLASAVVAMVALAEAGLSTTTTVFVSQDLASEDTENLSQTLTVTLGAMLILATLGAIALWLGAEAIINLFPKLEQFQQLKAVQTLQISAVVVWARLLQQIIIGVEQAYQFYGVMNLLITLQSLLSSLGLLAVAWLGGKTIALMQFQAVLSIAAFAAHVWVGWLLVKHLKLQPKWNIKKGLAIAHYSLVTWIASLGGVLFSQMDRLIVGALLGTGTLGVYAAITNVTVQINALSALPVQPLLPAISSLMAKQEAEKAVILAQVKQALQINSLLALGIGGALLTFAPFVLHLILAENLSPQYIVAFRIATVIYALYSVNAVGFYILFGVNSATTCMTIQLASGVVSLLLIYLGANNYGLMGAILGNAGYLGVWLLTFSSMKILRIPPRLWIGWLCFPMLYFAGIVLANIGISDQINIKILMLVLQVIILAVWFIVEQPKIFQIIKEYLVKKGTKR
ncbi:MAG: oligosaccharide flippase family protein [Aulosira sp. ZfuVER01]|nr:oligosaccharide flippase family protein [Aulosira sp. ZfuVER01]MDZ7999164.1 oligosaccharide flippase family protein [Aulosira sp. DedVER01a]MDZ8051112.1 oligosaccharide flippase family protein [Aulosira sp. ZfuCHP01]